MRRPVESFVSVVILLLYSVSGIAEAEERHPRSGAGGTQCTVNDGLGSGGYCVEANQPSACFLSSTGQSADCTANFVCCYFSLASLNSPTPGPSIFPPTISPSLPPVVTMVSLSPTIDPFAPVTAVPGGGGILPQPGLTRQCGRLRSDTGFDRKSLQDGLGPFGGNALIRQAGEVRLLDKKNRVKRLVGGEPVPDSEYCYQAAIISGNNVVATGVLISEDYVLTSYSGIARSDPSGRSFKILLGGSANLSPLIQAGIPGFSVLRVIPAAGFNPSYGPGFPINDAALIQINKGTGFDWSRLCTICLTPNRVQQTDCRSIFVSGYGSTSEASTTSDGILRRVGVNLIPKAVCENVYKSVFGKQFVFDTNSICAGGEPGRDTCNRDGGAPLTCINNNGDRYLLGLSSWGYGCGRSGFPGVYTNVTAFMPWIRTYVPL